MLGVPHRLDRHPVARRDRPQWWCSPDKIRMATAQVIGPSSRWNRWFWPVKCPAGYPQHSTSTNLTKCCAGYDRVNHLQELSAIIRKCSNFITSVEKSSGDVFAKRPISFKLFFAEELIGRGLVRKTRV
jgi:hypothetical protein